jgi:hypothetical protein
MRWSTQCDLVLNALRGGPKTMWELTTELRILRPGARIWELRKNHEITSERKLVQGRYVVLYCYRRPKTEQGPARTQRNARKGRFCSGCGKEFTPKKKWGRFCSAACRTADWKRQKALRGIEGQQRLEFANERLRSERERVDSFSTGDSQGQVRREGAA